MSLFTLIHGSMHGSWCFRDLVPELEGLGHSVAAPDLPCEDPLADLDVYAETVLDSIDRAGSNEDVVLVGHSLGSRTLPVVASRRAVSRMIFLCSVPTGAGAVDVASFEGMVTRDYLEADFDEREDGTRKMSEESARRVFFHDCEPETSRWAAAQLRWQGPRPLLEAAPFREWPDVPMDVILTRDDRSVDSAWAMAEAARWLNGRAPILLPGGHSPFLSHPRLLAETLVRGARGN